MIAMGIEQQERSPFSAVQLPRELIQRLQSFSESERGRNMGLTNKAQVAKAACLEFLNKYAPKDDDDPIRFVLPSLEDDELRIDVHIFKNKVSCNRCIDNKENCKHVDLLYKDKEVKGHLKKSKIVLPKKT